MSDETRRRDDHGSRARPQALAAAMTVAGAAEAGRSPAGGGV
jgi:hypothetical protein